ncbi:MAG TPA: hypothetical protein VFS15_14125 [Kofleriaceae bacterium]|nr:hypothetical protein [Kofleriaceae bacterium]
MSADVPRWELITAWALRVALVASGIAFLVREDWGFGVFCFLAVALVAAPMIVSRTSQFVWPIEVELVLLTLVTAHATLGYLFGFYARLAVFDKILHFSDSMLIGFLAFLAVYVAHYIRSDRTHRWIDVIAIFLITLGLGALWEICEFVADQWFGTHTQGSPDMSRINDTMWDLIVDGAGGVLAAILGPIYMHHSRRTRARVRTFADHLEHRGNRHATANAA